MIVVLAFTVFTFRITRRCAIAVPAVRLNAIATCEAVDAPVDILVRHFGVRFDRFATIQCPVSWQFGVVVAGFCRRV